MTKSLAITNSFKKDQHYYALVEECKSIIVESVFNSRMTLIEGYHAVGKEISEYVENGAHITSLLQFLAVDLEVSDRKLWYAVELYKKYNDLSKLPEGKNISITKLMDKYLTKHDKDLVKKDGWSICETCKRKVKFKKVA